MATNKKKTVYGPKPAPKSGRDPHGPSAPKKKKPVPFTRKKKMAKKASSDPHKMGSKANKKATRKSVRGAKKAVRKATRAAKRTVRKSKKK